MMNTDTDTNQRILMTDYENNDNDNKIEIYKMDQYDLEYEYDF